LLNLQTRAGGMPTFCRGWGALPFDRSTPEITAHALLACWTWKAELPADLQKSIETATRRALAYLKKNQATDGSWLPLWFGNEHTPDEINPVYGTAQVLNHLGGHSDLAASAADLIEAGLRFLGSAQKPDGSFGGNSSSPPSLEETAVALHALCLSGASPSAIHLSLDWLLEITQQGSCFPSAPIGLYFARLWYHERLYPVIWTLQALHTARQQLSEDERSV
ncbi:MAG: squalene--hopene cyclase, partial [Prosthecobacter sp.]